MRIGARTHLHRFSMLLATVTPLLLLFGVLLPIRSNAQAVEKVRSLQGQFFQEPNCPVSVLETRTDLDLDPFDNPIDARVYVTYSNISVKPISAVQFRIRLADSTGKSLGTFRASDGALLEPGQSHTQKYKRENINPAAVSTQIRVLQVKFADGTLWESVKLQELNNPNPQQPDQQTDQQPLPQPSAP